ncbi:type II secretion system minor pseudopilin GspK [Candidatus Symbiobacter mobilis]|uniref:Type II secretion system protein K n=1 Tax=Candidatus Symbiobacter mobilis CR TaxID=946483 RepID=U5NAM6_9BURK|nr:type II secretion system minor pseudopilin GspK [Candidatus Symbiobacter mobilis]AGX88335.1 general secretion pathway protein K [Candidatus Symbiobacter mobilis CR]
MPAQARSRFATQRGAAILTAMLVMTLVATMAAAMLWRQWQLVEVETARRHRVQAAWILTGALDWARLILREDARQGGADHLAEPWAIPLASARLGTFLAAQSGSDEGIDAADLEDTYLAGYIQDLQGRLNVRNLIHNGQPDPLQVQMWERLFGQLGLPAEELDAMLLGLQAAYATAGGGSSSSGGGSSAESGEGADGNAVAPLQPRRVEDLRALGLSPATLAMLRPFITILPVRTPLNLNTASEIVLGAALTDLDPAQAAAAGRARSAQHFRTLADAQTQLRSTTPLDSANFAVSSRYFGITGQLRTESGTVQETSIVRRDGLHIRVLDRTREVLGPAVTNPTQGEEKSGE